MEIFGLGLQRASSLQQLHLSRCAIGPKGIELLSKHLPDTLLFLDISDSGAEAQGVCALADAVHGSKALRLHRVTACNCKADDASLAKLARAFSERDSFTVSDCIEIDLGGNTVGASALEGLASCSTLRTLCLHDCKLGQEGAEALQRLLASSSNFKSLEELDISGNGLDENDLLGILTSLVSGSGTGGEDSKSAPSTVNCPKLRLLVVAANPGASEEGTTAAVEKLQAHRSHLNVVRRSADAGERSGGQAS